MTNEEERLDMLRNIRGMSADFKKEYNRCPTVLEFAEALSISQRSVFRYKKIINEEDKQQLLELFESDLIIDAKELIQTISENIKIFKDIRDTGETNIIRMAAATNMKEGYLDKLRIKRDGPEFVTGKYESNLGVTEEDEKEVADVPS